MSNSYKCGKELPAGQVECEYGCPPRGEPPMVEGLHKVDLKKPLSAEDVVSACSANMTLLILMVQPDHDKILNEADVREFGAALQRWLKLIARGYEESGLSHWCKRPEGL